MQKSQWREDVVASKFYRIFDMFLPDLAGPLQHSCEVVDTLACDVETYGMTLGLTPTLLCWNGLLVI